MKKIHPKRNLCIFSDFDSTITKKDACLKIPNLKTQKDWNRVSSSYLKHFQQNFENNFENLKKGKKEFKDLMFEFSKELDISEQFGVSKLEEYKILKGIQKKQLFDLGFTTEQKEYFSDFINLVHKLNIPFHVVSSNWSFDVIRGNLSKNGIEACFYKQNQEDKFIVFSDDLEFQQNIATGNFLTKEATSSLGKLKYIKDIMKKYHNSKSVYIGDDWVDLSCLLEVDYPIIINPTEKLNILIDQLNDSCKNFHYVDSWSAVVHLIESFDE
eukprot:gene2798-4206_t